MDYVYRDANHCDTEAYLGCEKCGAFSPVAADVYQAWHKSKLKGWYAVPVIDYFGEKERWLHYCPNCWKAAMNKIKYEKAKQREYDELRRNNIVLWHQKRIASGGRVKRNVTLKTRLLVMKRDNHKCKLCGRSPEDGAKLHVDHIVPISKGGTNEVDNLQTLCDLCNLGKSNVL